jgi:ribosomal protein S18 acetylase RimI-like enzyme
VVDLSVRRIRRDEGRTLKVLRLRALADAPHAFGLTLAEASQRSDEEWAALAEQGAESATEAVFFAESERTLLGMVMASVDDDDGSSSALRAMWVASTTRRQGVGRALVSAAVEWCSTIGTDKVQLWVARTNPEAIALYESMNFVIVPDAQPPAAWGGAADRWAMMARPTS